MTSDDLSGKPWAQLEPGTEGNVMLFHDSQPVMNELTILGSPETQTPSFRDSTHRLTGLMGARLRQNYDQNYDDSHLVALLSVLRAGLAPMWRMTELFPLAMLLFVGITRDEESNPVVWYKNFPSAVARVCIVLEPMLATGGSAREAVRLAYEWGATQVVLFSFFGVKQGISHVLEGCPDTKIYLGRLCYGLNKRNYIIDESGQPSVGDYGNRAMGASSENARFMRIMV